MYINLCENWQISNRRAIAIFVENVTKENVHFWKVALENNYVSYKKTAE